jgi:hypothetical protein
LNRTVSGAEVLLRSFANPTAVYCGARRYGAPFLTVILDNAGWHAIRTSTLQQHPSGVAQQRDDLPSSFAPEAELALVAESAGARTWWSSAATSLRPRSWQVLRRRGQAPRPSGGRGSNSARDGALSCTVQACRSLRAQCC